MENWSITRLPAIAEELITDVYNPATIFSRIHMEGVALVPTKKYLSPQ